MSHSSRNAMIEKEIKDPNGITEMSPALAKYAPDLELMGDVNAGQRRLIEKSSIYLPQEPFETNSGYITRLTRASLRNFLLKVKRLATSTVLRKPIGVEGDAGDFTKWVTSDGQNIQIFAKNLLEAAWLEGFALVMTEFPRVNEAANLREQRAAGYRPYWNLIKRSQLLEASAVMGTRMVDGTPVYSQVLDYIRFKAWMSDNNRGVEPVVMEYERGIKQDSPVVAWRKWAVREVKNEPVWVQVDDGVIDLPYIPISALYIEQEGFMKASIPLLETGHLTLRHFVVASDMYQLLHLSASPKFYIAGADVEDMDMSKSANVGLVFESPDTKVGWATLDASPVEEHRQTLQELKSELLNGAVQIFEQKRVAETEGSKALDREQSDSLLALSAQALEQCLNRALEHAAAYLRTNPATVTVNKKFNLSQVDPQEFTAWLQGWLSNAYTQETFLKKLEAAGFFEDVAEYDREAELERTSALG